METRKIIIGDTEIRLPKNLVSLGLFPIIGIIVVLWLLTGIYSVGPDEVGVSEPLARFHELLSRACVIICPILLRSSIHQR